MSEPIGVDPVVVAKSLRALIPRGIPFEVRALGCRNGRVKPHTVAGYFDDVDTAVEEVAALDVKSSPVGVYVTINRIAPALMARSENHLTPYLESTTGDADITRLAWLPVDIDPVRPAGISASKKEKRAAQVVAGRVYVFLKRQGWSEPIQADSGNGRHLCYMVDLKNTPENVQLVGRVLKALAQKFNTAQVKVDTSTANPARIFRLWGSVARKGESTPDRPHRQSRIVSKPSRAKVVPLAKLEKVAALVSGESTDHHADGDDRAGRLDVARWLTDHEIKFKVRKKGDWTHYQLARCPFNGDHGGRDTVVMQHTDGGLKFKCLHNRCAEKTWEDVKKKIGPPGPEHWGRPRSGSRNAEATSQNKKGRKPRVEEEPGLVCLSDVEELRVKWYWPSRIPLGKLTVFCGDPDLGKGFVSIDIAARSTRESHWPDGGPKIKPCSALLIGSEDGLRDTLKPRLRAAGANMRRVFSLAIDNLKTDLDKMERVLTGHKDIRLLIIDPASAYMEGVNTHKNAEVRAVLRPLAQLAEKHRVAVVAVEHLTKGDGTPAIYRTNGSIALIAAPRSAWMFLREPGNPERRLMLRVKGNLAKEAPGLAFRIVDSSIRQDAKHFVGKVQWEGQVTERVEQVLQGEGQDGPAQRFMRDEARVWLQVVLSKGRVPKREIQNAADANGHSWSTVRKAADELGIKSVATGHGPGSVTYWELSTSGKRK